MDLMENIKFREFIEQFRVLLEDSKRQSLEETRRKNKDFFCPPNLVKEAVDKIVDIRVTGQEGHSIPVRIYRPTQANGLPLFIYYHRGGWVFSSVEEADAVCRKLANHLGCVIASVDYRLAPENPFPKPFNDAYDAFVWLAKHAKKYGADPKTIIVGGESVGGNLAAAVALKARDCAGPLIALQLLLYPVITSTINETPYIESADKYFITKGAMEFFWSMYLQNSEDGANCYASPEKAANLEQLPPTLIVTAGHDPLQAEAEAYGFRLKVCGNQVVIKKFPKVVHGFLDLPIYSDGEVATWLLCIKEKLEQMLSFASIMR